MTRRQLLVGGASAFAYGWAQPTQPALRLMAVGQSLILEDFRSAQLPGYGDLRAHLRGSDVAFTNLEATIRGESARDVRVGSQAVVADSGVLDTLRDAGFKLLSLANNHADDLGAAGILSTIEEARRRGFVIAGTGRSLSEAAAPGYLETAKGRVALIAVASGALPPGTYATDSRPGVHHLAQQNGVVDPRDAARVMTAIQAAGKDGTTVVVYQHDHYWAADWQDTPSWKRDWCRACIDAGATIFVSHGVPLLHGVEIYKRRPIFYGLGNFVFHASNVFGGRVPRPYDQRECWQSVIADCDLLGNEMLSLKLRPITLKTSTLDGADVLHGNPRFASAGEAAEILGRLQKLSRPLGTVISIDGSTGSVPAAPR